MPKPRAECEAGNRGVVSVPPTALHLRTMCLDWKRPYVMGVVNLTPDSFSDGGRYCSVDSACRQAEALINAGADILDLGGESTRPGASRVSEDEECRRVLPIVEKISSAMPIVLSVDTTKAVVARRALDAGAEIINDISGGCFDDEMFPTIENADCVYICGHVRGHSLDEIHACEAQNIFDVTVELRHRLDLLPQRVRERTVIDPCLGFGKSLNVNLALVNRAGELGAQLSAPVLLGPSRKRFLGQVTGLPVDQRDAATMGACLAGISSGAHMVRVHNVGMVVAAVRVFCAARNSDFHLEDEL